MNPSRIDPRISPSPLPASTPAERAARATPPAATPAGDSAPANLASRALALGFSTRFDRAFRDGLEATRTLDSLDEIGTHLDELAALVKQSGDTSVRTAAVDVSARIDALVKTINTAADQALGSRVLSDAAGLTYTRGQTPQIPPPALSVSSVSDGVERLRAFAILPPGGSIDVDVVVTQSAQQAGFYLSFGSTSLNLSAAAARFEIEIAGNLGVQSLSFASGTQVAAIADAINAFTDITGVRARLSGSGGVSGRGIALNSTEFGDDRFVSVRVISSGGVNLAQADAGVYEYQATNANAAAPAPSSRTLFYVTTPITDLGQDIAGTVNGRGAQGSGRSLYAVTPNVLTQFRLTPDAAQRLGSFRAFTIHRVPAAADAAASEPPASIDDSRLDAAPPPLLDSASLDSDIDRARQAFALARRAIVDHVAASIRPVIDAHLGVPASGPPVPLDAERVRALLAPPKAT